MMDASGVQIILAVRAASTISMMSAWCYHLTAFEAGQAECWALLDLSAWLTAGRYPQYAIWRVSWTGCLPTFMAATRGYRQSI